MTGTGDTCVFFQSKLYFRFSESQGFEKYQKLVKVETYFSYNKLQPLISEKKRTIKRDQEALYSERIAEQ